MVFTRSKRVSIEASNLRYFIVPDELDSENDSDYVMKSSNESDNSDELDIDMELDDNEEKVEELDDNIQSIYEGDFFEMDPFEFNLDNLKKINDTDLSDFNNQLTLIKKNYADNTPTVVEILKKDIPLLEKQKLLERMYHLANCEVLSPEYYSNLKALNTGLMSVSNPELMELEKKILESSINKDMSESYKHRVLKSKMSFENKVISYNKIEIMETYMNNDASEYAKHKMWIDTLLSVPFGIYNDSGITIQSPFGDIKDYIKNVRQILDSKLSFLEKPKDQIINIITQRMRNSSSNINAIGLHSGVGMGKTSIAKSIAEALNRPFKMISLGGESDANTLTGHGFTYIGSNAGSIINSLIDTRSMEPVVLLDEIDKISETHQGKEIIGTLIHLIDSTSNNKYNHDKYLAGIEFDLSRVLFIFTYNEPTKVDKILADRLFKIHVENYTFKEKLEITNKHLIRNVLEKFKLSNNDIQFSSDAISYLVQSNKANGMRDIKTRLEIIFSRINTLLLTDECDSIINLKYKKLYSFYKTLPVIIPKEHIDIFLDESISNDLESKVPFHMYI
jgi:ATP-dependent Lon protease